MSECEVWFYHLERTSLEAVLPELLEKTLARGWRALVRGLSREGLERLDRLLWTWRDDSFLAHGFDDDPAADRQPILLTTAEANANRAQALFLVDGARADDIAEFERCIVIFDGHSEDAVAQARASWADLKQAGSPVSYWRQGESRGWQKQVS